MASNLDLGRLLTLLVVLLGVAGCTRASEPRPIPPKPFTVYAVNYPLAYFAERLSSKNAEVVFPAPPDVDPADWHPTSDTIVEFQNADRILLSGAGDAAWTRTSTLPRSKMVFAAVGCRDAFLETDSSAVHRHGPEGTHSHARSAFATWLDLGLAACQAGRIRDALVRAQPDDAPGIRSRWTGLEQDLSDLDASLRKAAGALGGVSVFASHPVYDYLGDAYGLEIQSFHFEPGRPLEAEALADLDSATKSQGPSVMLWEDAPLAATRKALEDRGIRVVVFDPLANRPSDGDFVGAMQRNVERLQCAADAGTCP